MNYQENLEGGKVIDSGGYGCVFRPSLKCPGVEQNDEQISKLMLNRHGEKEYNLLEQFKTLLKNIPNYGDYFLLDGISMCHPEHISEADLVNYGECETLIEDGITKDNINQKLQQISSINMPFGGITVESYIDKNLNSQGLLDLNNSLINLLTKGVIPMNNLNIYHSDLKSSNVLINKKDGKLYTRIIDWGLSFVKDNNFEMSKIGRPFQFNLPFSCVLFRKEFNDGYNSFYENNSDISYRNIQTWVVGFLNIIVKSRKGHISVMKMIINRFNYLKSNFFGKSKITSANDYIVNYLTNIIYKYTNKFKSDIIKNSSMKVSDYILNSYFEEIYIKNVDIWGFMTIYLEIYEPIYKNKILLKNNLNLLNKIKQIMVNHLYLNSTRVINITKLIDDLKILNNYIKRFKGIDYADKQIGGRGIAKTHKYRKIYKNYTRRL